MKIQKLIIHNIASIEDATIDFEQNPLADSEVFLITGKTGSGKSTILDAICLALYADTPRLDNTQMQGKLDDDTIQIDDPRQLMRRNTGEAFASLTFIGKNGVHYEAEWSVARARKNASGRLQQKVWTLTNIDRNTVLSRDAEIRAEISAAIGLDFQQFCRTTMLAQGQFTRFLNSEDNEKAAILEKITGVDIYSKIGAKVFKVTSDKKKDWEISQGLADGTKTLSAEEVEDKRHLLEDLSAEYKVLNEECQKEIAKRDWLKKEEDLSMKVKAASTELQEAKHITESDDFKQKEKLIKEWNATIDARSWLTEESKAQDDLNRQKQTLYELSKKYALLLGGLQFAKQETAGIEAKIRKIVSFLDDNKDKVPVFENAQTIVGHLKTIVESCDSIRKNNIFIDNEKKNLDNQFRPDFIQAQSAEKSAKDAFYKQEKKVKEEEKNEEGLKLSELRTQRDDALQLIVKIDRAIERLEGLSDEQKRRKETENRLSSCLKSLNDKEKQSFQMEQPLREAKLVMDSKKEDLEQQKDTINKFAKLWRSKLQVGDTCPVCRQKVAKKLPHEEELSSLIMDLNDSFKKAEEKFNGLNDAKNQLDAEIKTERESYIRDKNAFDGDTSLDTTKAKAMEACLLCGIETIDDKSLSSLSELKDKTNDKRNKLDAQIEEGENKVKALNQLRKTLETQRKYVESLVEASQKAEKAIKDCQNRITNTETLIASKNKDAMNAKEQVQELVGTNYWENDWRTSPKEFAEELSIATQAFNENVSKKNELVSDYRSAKENCDNVEEVVKNIRVLMSEWAEIKPETTNMTDHLLSKANSIYKDTATTLDRFNTAEKTLSEKRNLLNIFIENHSEFNLERLKELNCYNSKQITDENEQLGKLHSNLNTKDGALKAIKKQQDDHQQNKPELTDSDTIEFLGTRISELGEKLRLFTEKTGAIHQELTTDEANKRQLWALVAETETKKTEYQKWQRLNDLIGDALGNKFRRIAQSYVLANLIHSANHYMSTLTERYSLKLQPGTFIILIEDAFQGYATRAASTISGGESFLVSLALALALSDIGQSLSVDTLFIDEGFGTLSGEPLQNAVDTLRTLHSTSGRHVGIISHVEELQERIPVQIQVNQEGNNSSSQIKIVP